MSQFDLRKAINIGLLGGVIALSVSMIGMVETFDQRDVITGVISLGQLLLFSASAGVGYLTARQYDEKATQPVLLSGLVAGVMSGLPLFGLILVTMFWTSIRDSFVNVSESLVDILTFGMDPIVGGIVLILAMTAVGVLGAVIHILPDRIRKPFVYGLFITLGIGMLSEVLLNILRPFGRSVTRLLFGTKGITPITAVVIFIGSIIWVAWWNANGRDRYQARRAAMSETQQGNARKASIGAGALLLMVLPFILGTYLTEVIDNVGLYILMGFGLNIVVGFAGLLDLGYVAFFAIGAYMMGILTSTGDIGIAQMSFWAALPLSVGASVLAGVTLGIPVLRMRGDYLAIVTLGFGEIIRVLVNSDLLKPYIGGAQGILQIPKPEAFGFIFVQPRHSYYLILAGCILAAFVSWRLRDSRAGRRWMALREDEDVAEAMGIQLVTTKLLAFGMGAAFSGLAGAIFASRLSSIFPHSFNLLISINVLSLIIVGGIGSLPGVVVGALVLVGMPELLREFAEYRLLLYGALLIAMMLARPEGLWPSPITRREMHPDELDVGPETPASGIPER